MTGLSLAYPAGEPGVVDLGQRHYVLKFHHLSWMWWHDCRAVEHVSWGWIGDQGDGIRSGHVIESTSPLTVAGSLICLDCRDHGFITGGRWVPA